MATHVTVTVPAQDAERMLTALLDVYAARAAHLADHVTDAARVQEAREGLAAVERMLDLFGWERGRRVRAAELSGPEAEVGEVLRLALSDAHDALGAGIVSYHRGHADLDELAAEAQRLNAMLARFSAFERDHSL